MTHSTPLADPPAPAGETEQSLRRLGRDTMLYGLGTVLARIVSFVMLPVYTRYLTPADYGLLQILDMALDIAAILVSAGATAGLLRFYFKTRDPEARKDLLATAWWIQVGLNAIGTLLLLAGSGVIWRVALDGAGTPGLVRLAALNFTLGTLSGVPLALLQARQQPSRYIAVTLTRLVLQLSLNILFVVGMRLGPKGVLLSSFFTHLTLGLVLSAWLLRHTGIRWSTGAFRNLRRYGLPYQFAKAGTFILAFGDRFFLEHYHGLAVVGVYGIAYQFGFLLTGNVAGPFLRAWNPQRHALAHAAREERDRSYNRGFFYGDLLLVTVAVGLSLFIRPVLHVMVTEEFRAAAALVPVILLAYLMQSWTYVVEFGIQVAERTRYSTYATWISVALILVLYAVLIPPFGGMGAAIATLGSTTARFLLHYYWSHQLWPVRYQWGPHLRLVGWGVLVVASAFALPTPDFGSQLAVGLALTAVYALAVWVTVLRAWDRDLIRRLGSSPRELFRFVIGA